MMISVCTFAREILGLFGANGSEKPPLVQIIGLSPTSGHVYLEEKRYSPQCQNRDCRLSRANNASFGAFSVQRMIHTDSED
jgi:ABC-type Mn2+/Zn2+ transport system ATPase subunit